MQQKKISSAWLIDDDKIYLFGLRKMIEISKRCDSITEFSNGSEAIRKLQTMVDSPELLPDIIFLDINMPVMDGWQFLTAFDLLKKQLSRQIIIYMISSSIDDRDIERAKQLDAVKNYIIKPLPFDKLQSIFANEIQ
ncbi:MAG: response regulator [Filimonas sp.]|nr:response regulator [Filimonas sp.]